MSSVGVEQVQASVPPEAGTLTLRILSPKRGLPRIPSPRAAPPPQRQYLRRALVHHLLHTIKKGKKLRFLKTIYCPKDLVFPTKIYQKNETRIK